MKALNAAELCTLEWPRWGRPGGPVVRTPGPWGAGSLPVRKRRSHMFQGPGKILKFLKRKIDS